MKRSAVREKPRISLNGLAGYLVASASRRRRIITEQKRPRAFQVTQIEELTVYEAYNAATWYATHQMRSYRTAFELLALVNRSFQERFPAGTA